MIRTILTECASALGYASLMAAGALLAACAVAPPPAPAPVCEALRPDMPVKFHGGPDGKGGPGYDTRDTIDRARRANARFEAACGKAGA